MDNNNLQSRIQSVGRELQWKLMPSAKFVTQFVTVANDMSENELSILINNLNEETFTNWTKKLWTEQDIQPDPDNYNAAYNESKPILSVLKRSLLVRIVKEKDRSKRIALEQQLALASLILEGPERLSQITGIPK